jgi:hypothetical protein
MASRTVTPTENSMIDVQSLQQALQAYSSATGHTCCILCRACHGGCAHRTRSPRHIPGRHGRAHRLPPEHQCAACDFEPLAPEGAYLSRASTPHRDGSHVGHGPNINPHRMRVVAVLRLLPVSVCSVCSVCFQERQRMLCGERSRRLVDGRRLIRVDLEEASHSERREDPVDMGAVDRTLRRQDQPQPTRA